MHSQARNQQVNIRDRYLRSRDITRVSKGLDDPSIVKGTHGRYERSCFTIQTHSDGKKLLLGVPRHGNGLDRDEWVKLFTWLALRHNKDLKGYGVEGEAVNGLGHNPTFESPGA
eukprot:scaffold2576_cov418-Prasinococcus_capsulatus_cf.AAC.3